MFQANADNIPLIFGSGCIGDNIKFVAEDAGGGVFYLKSFEQDKYVHPRGGGAAVDNTQLVFHGGKGGHDKI